MPITGQKISSHAPAAELEHEMIRIVSKLRILNQKWHIRCSKILAYYEISDTHELNIGTVTQPRENRND